MIHWGVTGAGSGIKLEPPGLTYKLARQAMSAIKRFRGHTLRIRIVADTECELSPKVGYKNDTRQEKILFEKGRTRKK